MNAQLKSVLFILAGAAAGLGLLQLLDSSSGGAPAADEPPASAEARAWVRSLSEEDGKERPLLVLFTAPSWCPPCRRLEEKVLPRPEVREALERLRVVKIDPRSPGEHRAAAGFKATRFVPEGVVVDTGGDVLGRLSARRLQDPGALVAGLESALARAE